MGATSRQIERIYRSRHRGFVAAVTATVGSPEDAAEIVQDGFAQALARRDCFRGDGALEAWIWKIVLRKAALPRRPAVLDRRGDLRDQRGNGRRDAGASSRRARTLAGGNGASRGRVGKERALTTPLNLDAQLDRDLRARLRAATTRETAPHWRDVERRARTLTPGRQRPRRRPALALALAAVAVAVPAFAVASGVIDFSSSPSAPEPVKVLFGKLDAIDPLHGPGAVTGQTRLVYTFHTDGGSYALAVAPSRDGWCWGIVGRDMTCNTPTSGLNYGYNPPPAVDNQPLLIDGSIAAAGVARITITFEDGSTVDVPFVQVSPPVDADFFLYEVDARHSKPGSRPSTIAAYDADDVVVGSGWFIRESDAPVVGTKG